MPVAISTTPSRAPGRTVLRLQGEFDLTSVDLVTNELGKVEESPEVVVDVRDLTFLDSCGLAVLVHFDARMRSRNRALALLIGEGQVKHLFELTGLLDELTVVSALDELPRP